MPCEHASNKLLLMHSRHTDQSANAIQYVVCYIHKARAVQGESHFRQNAELFCPRQSEAALTVPVAAAAERVGGS